MHLIKSKYFRSVCLFGCSKAETLLFFLSPSTSFRNPWPTMSCKHWHHRREQQWSRGRSRWGFCPQYSISSPACWVCQFSCFVLPLEERMFLTILHGEGPAAVECGLHMSVLVWLTYILVRACGGLFLPGGHVNPSSPGTNYWTYWIQTISYRIFSLRLLWKSRTQVWARKALCLCVCQWYYSECLVIRCPGQCLSLKTQRDSVSSYLLK